MSQDKTVKQMAKQQATAYLNMMSEKACCEVIPIVDLGRVPLLVSDFLNLTENVQLYKWMLRDTAVLRVIEKMVKYEKVVIKLAVNLPADESKYLFELTECENGYVGNVLMCPSPLSPMRSQYFPCSVFFNPDDEDAKLVKSVDDVITPIRKAG